MDKETSEILDLASAAGHLLLENGAEISRVEEAMERISAHYGVKHGGFFVLSNGIFTTGGSYANVEFIPIRGARLDKVVAVNQLSRDIESKNLSVGEAWARLEQIRTMPERSSWQQLIASLLGSAGFCAIFGGGLADCAAAGISGLLLYAFVLFLGPGLSKMLSNICGGLVGAAAAMLCCRLGLGANLGNIIVGALIPLIPGVAFTNALRDLANEDYIAGTTRLLDSLIMFFSIALGAILAFVVQSWIVGGMVQLHGTVTDSLTAILPLQLAAALIGTTAFAVLFGVPEKYCIHAGVVGTLGWFVYLAASRWLGCGLVLGTFAAAAVVALVSRWYARWQKCPSTVFLICGIFPLIPGAGVFWSSYYVVSSQFRPALFAGLDAVKVTIAIVLAIIVATNIFHSPAKGR